MAWANTAGPSKTEVTYLRQELTRRYFLQAVAAGSALGAPIPQSGKEHASGASGNGKESSGGTDSLQSSIFPAPQYVSGSGSHFVLDERVRILIPTNASDQDRFLARSLAHELSDLYGIHLKIESVADLTGKKQAIVIGSLGNPLIRQEVASISDSAGPQDRPEGYLLRANSEGVLVAGHDARGAFYGFQSLRQLITHEGNEVHVPGVIVRDWPDKPYRGLCLFLPGRENITFFKRFVRDFAALYKYNTLVLEMNACMRLDRHPELNSGWVEFARDINYSALNYPPGSFHDLEQNSSHQDCCEGRFLEKEEIADLADWTRRHHIELIPQIPSFSHSYYLLTKHRELAAVPQNKWPDIYCPSNPETYSLVFDVYDEYIEVLKPKTIHIGHDELFLPIGVSSQCVDDNIGELYGQDVKKIHDHLASRGVRTALWGDMLLESVRGVGPQKKAAADGTTYYSPGALTPDQVKRLIPKDCLIYNWFWKNEPGSHRDAEQDEAYLDQMGFEQVYGNFEPDIEHYEARKKRSTLLGGVSSAWYGPNELLFGKDFIADFLGCSSILWTGRTMPARALSEQVQAMVPSIRVRMSDVVPPSQTEATIVPINISGKYNTKGRIPVLGVDVDSIKTGTVHCGNMVFDLPNSDGMRSIVVETDGAKKIGLAKQVTSIPVGEAPTSLIFLHASARPALNRNSVRLIWDRQDTADLLGWYEVIYEDGFVTIIPIRYGVNILECNWEERTSFRDYCYNADPLGIGAESPSKMTFFVYEWINPRLGKVIQEINLKGSTGFRGGGDDWNNDVGPVIESNAVMVAALSMVRKRCCVGNQFKSGQ